MNKETQIYIDNIKHSIEDIKNKQQLPKWQIDFEKYGGRVEYERIKTMFWDKASDFINYERDREIVDLYNSGMTQSKIADLYCLCQSSIVHITNKFNKDTNYRQYTLNNFPYIDCMKRDITLMQQFRKDLNVQLDIPKKYDIYR